VQLGIARTFRQAVLKINKIAVKINIVLVDPAQMGEAVRIIGVYQY
jgi:hypothetical protein